MPQNRVTFADLANWKQHSTPFVMVAASDFPSARMLDEAGVPIVAVGDSLARIVLGRSAGEPITVEEMRHHVRAARHGVTRALLLADLPSGSYESTPETARGAARYLVAPDGADIVKLDGGRELCPTVALLSQDRIPVAVGIHGRSTNDPDGLVADAHALQDAGAQALVLVAAHPEHARRVTEAVSIVTIGAGSGPHVDGQSAVWHWLLGLHVGGAPRFAKSYADLRPQIAAGIAAFQRDVATGAYPAREHSYP